MTPIHWTGQETGSASRRSPRRPRSFPRCRFGPRVRPGRAMDVPSNSLAHDLEITQIERDQEKITNCFQMWTADVCSSLRRKAETIGFDDVVYVLRYRYSAGNLQLGNHAGEARNRRRSKSPVLCCGWRLSSGIERASLANALRSLATAQFRSPRSPALPLGMES
jgi:hypothetical protein